MDFWYKDMLSFFVKYLGTYRKKAILHGCEDSHLLLGLILKDGTSVKLPISQQYALAVFRRSFQNWELLRYWAWNICFFYYWPFEGGRASWYWPVTFTFLVVVKVIVLATAHHGGYFCGFGVQTGICQINEEQ